MICMVTDRRRLSASADAADRLVDLAGAMAHAGVDLIQVRERDLSAAELSILVERCVAAANGTAARVVVNDRADVAVAAGAGGVHLRGDSIAPAKIRALLPDATIGRSVHAVTEAQEIAREGAADYLVFGTLFSTASKDGLHQYATIEDLAAICRTVRMPVLGIGGVTLSSAPQLRRAGAAGVAGIGLFIPPAGVTLTHHAETIVSELRQLFDTFEPVP